MKLQWAILIALTCLPMCAQGEIYTCVDKYGNRTYQQSPCPGQNKTQQYVRCIRPDGSSYIRTGDSCPPRREATARQPGVSIDVKTGKSIYLVPTGPTTAIDAHSQQQYQYTSPPPSRQVRDRAQPLSANQACASEKVRLDSALTDRNRTMTSIRAARDRYERMCGG